MDIGPVISEDEQVIRNGNTPCQGLSLDSQRNQVGREDAINVRMFVE